MNHIVAAWNNHNEGINVLSDMARCNLIEELRDLASVAAATSNGRSYHNICGCCGAASSSEDLLSLADSLQTSSTSSPLPDALPLSRQA